MGFLCIVVLASALLLGWLGRNRKFGFWGFFFASIAFTPLVSALLLLASDPRPRPPVR